MKQQLFVALGVIAVGAAFGLVSPANAQGYHDGHGPGWQPVGYVRPAPPPPRYEPHPGARRGQVWMPGYWVASGPRYAWRAGHWERARPGYRYVPDRWEQGPRNGWARTPGYWAR